MKIGLIDVGSNTVRAVCYEVSGKEFIKKESYKNFLEIITYVENGCLSDEGIEKICACLKDMKEKLQSVSCFDCFCFATASFRGIENLTEVMAKIRKYAEISMLVISGEQEAYYDYLGLSSMYKEGRGAGFDLGGGSCQVLTFEGGSLNNFCSLKMGSLYLYKSFVAGIIPETNECKSISKYVKKELKKFSHEKMETIYGMGGTARALGRLHRFLAQGKEPMEGYTIKAGELSELTLKIKNRDAAVMNMIETRFKERRHTIIPGIMVIDELMNFFEAEEYKVTKVGVREGFLIHLLEEKEQTKGE